MKNLIPCAAAIGIITTLLSNSVLASGIPCEDLKLSVRLKNFVAECSKKKSPVNNMGVSAGVIEQVTLRGPNAGGSVHWFKTNGVTYIRTVRAETFFKNVPNVESQGKMATSSNGSFKYLPMTRDWGAGEVGCIYFVKFAGQYRESGSSQRVHGVYCDGTAERISDEKVEAFFAAIDIDDRDYRSGVAW